MLARIVSMEASYPSIPVLSLSLQLEQMSANAPGPLTPHLTGGEIEVSMVEPRQLPRPDPLVKPLAELGRHRVRVGTSTSRAVFDITLDPATLLEMDRLRGENGDVWLNASVCVDVIWVDSTSKVQTFRSEWCSVVQDERRPRIKIPASEWAGYMETWGRNVLTVEVRDPELRHAIEEIAESYEIDERDVILSALKAYVEKERARNG